MVPPQYDSVVIPYYVSRSNGNLEFRPAVSDQLSAGQIKTPKLGPYAEFHRSGDPYIVSGMDPRLARGVREFNAGNFFAAHEIWEELWNDSVGAEKTLLQA